MNNSNDSTEQGDRSLLLFSEGAGLGARHGENDEKQAVAAM